MQVFCYALSPNDGTEWRQRTQFEAEHFIDVSAMTSDMIAKLINEDKIQILINLNGYTKVCLVQFYPKTIHHWMGQWRKTTIGINL